MLDSGAAFATSALASFAPPSIAVVLAEELHEPSLAYRPSVAGRQLVGVVRIHLEAEDA